MSKWRDRLSDAALGTDPTGGDGDSLVDTQSPKYTPPPLPFSVRAVRVTQGPDKGLFDFVVLDVEGRYVCECSDAYIAHWIAAGMPVNTP